MQYGRAIAPDTFRLERTLKAPIEKVWAHLVDAEKRQRWFTAGDDFTDHGQRFTIKFGHHRITDEKPPARWSEMERGEFEMQGRILAFEPPRLIAFTWGDGDEHVSEVRFELTSRDDETLLVLTHSRVDTNANIRNYAGGWTAHVQALADLLDGRSTNTFWANVLDAHAKYEADDSQLIPKFDGPVVRVARTIKAPVERIYDAWLDPKMIERFMMGPGVRDEEIVHLNVDARVGGRFSFLVRRGGQLIDHVGEYRDLDRPRRIIFTWGVDEEAGDTSIVTIDITPKGDASEFVLTHQMHPKWADYAERTQQGWTFIVDKWAEVLAEK
ncbi:MAG TPA: SRPBCC domain-containing protein [Vitreimonas sp.]|uniref:SRPBCC domain-containing protein n=1 Tax=Vitreimonas sp. TaxID=3069702 RepID=UPI002D5570E0|nr:SRPBCC domain-containing protein [Vitreimonas sp.]HYD88188.1 SRPBCC domain-containing protein [Vitreimonas sp.]